MRVLGIDPGSRVTGIGVVDAESSNLKVVDYSCIRAGKEVLSIRLGKIYQGVAAAVEKYQPDMVAVEDVFFANNAKSALILGQARGSAICAAVNHDCEVVEYTALQIKRAVVGSGGARKEQVQHMVRVLLGLRQNPAADAADALACAICHIHTWQVESRLRMAQS